MKRKTMLYENRKLNREIKNLKRIMQKSIVKFILGNY